MTIKITDTPLPGEIIIRDGTATVQFQALMETYELAINLNTPLIGAGSPEGVITAQPYQVYLDTSGGAGTIQYRKMTGTGNTGWVLV